MKKLASFFTVLAISQGDLVFIKSQTAQSQALRDATHSEWTHVGIYLDDKIYESTGLTSLNSFIKRSKNSEYTTRSIPEFQDTPEFRAALKKYYKKPYDIYFEWSDDKIYCSEFVYKIFLDAFNVEIGQKQTFNEMDLNHDSVQQLIKNRYKNGKEFNMDEIIVTPISTLNGN